MRKNGREYKIVEAGTALDLSKKVNELTRSGEWELQGGVNVTDRSHGSTVYSQALSRQFITLRAAIDDLVAVASRKTPRTPRN